MGARRQQPATTIRTALGSIGGVNSRQGRLLGKEDEDDLYQRGEGEGSPPSVSAI
jgi:hypothetical protein